jgi:hypothetical protein
LGANYSDRSIIVAVFGRAASPHRLRLAKLDATRFQRFAQQAFDLRINRPEIGGRGALDRRPQCRVDPQWVGFAVGNHHQHY